MFPGHTYTIRALPKEEFDKGVQTLTEKVQSLSNAKTFSELSQKERECRGALFALQHYSMRLGYWVKQEVDRQRQVINQNATLATDYLHTPLTKDPHQSAPSPAPKPKKRTSTKKTSAKKKAEPEPKPKPEPES